MPPRPNPNAPACPTCGRQLASNGWTWRCTKCGHSEYKPDTYEKRHAAYTKTERRTGIRREVASCEYVKVLSAPDSVIPPGCEYEWRALREMWQLDPEAFKGTRILRRGEVMIL